jgi:pantetheine-phosphate adenylyltransferase
MELIGIYPGSFDPMTNGHLDVMIRASKVVDKLIVGVLNNPSKKNLFTVEERVQQLRVVTEGFDNIEIEPFQGLLMDFAKQKNAKVIIRGLRAVTDFEYEFQMALANRSLTKEVETMFLTTSTQYLFLSSSVVKEIASFGGNIDEMVPRYVVDKIKEKYI